MSVVESRPLVVDLSPRLAGHVATALRAHRNWLRGMGILAPEGLAELETVCVSRARAGQVGTPLADLWRVADDRVVAARLLTYADCADALALSERTVKRLVAKGELPAVRIGPGTSRVRVTDLDAFVAALTTEGSEAA